jgi:spore coat protein U-like protein
MTIRHPSRGRSVLAVAGLAMALQAAVATPADAAGGPCGLCFAVVRANATIANRSHDGVTVRKRGTGRFEVDFGTGAVAGCAMSATLFNSGNFAAPTGSVTVGRANTTPVTVALVATFGAGGSPADRAFHLIVMC